MDSTKAVELIPVESKRAIFRKTYYRDHHKSIYSTLKTLDNTLKDTSKELRVGRYSTAHKATFAPPTSIYTVLKTAVKVPPDVSVNLSRCQNSNWDDQNVVLMGEPYLQHFADDVRIIPDKQAIYTFMIKNKLKSRISVDVSLQVNTIDVSMTYIFCD